MVANASGERHSETKSKEKAWQGAWASESHPLPKFVQPAARGDATANSQGRWQQDIAGSRTQFTHSVSQPFPRADDDSSCKYLP